MNTGDPNEQEHSQASVSSDVVIPIQIETLVTSKSKKPKLRKKRSKMPVVIGALICIALVVVVAVQIIFPMPVDITLNGEALHITNRTKLADILETEVDPKAGDLLAVDGSIIEQGKGGAFKALVNGVEQSNLDTTFAMGDVVEIDDGDDLTEEYVEEAITYPAVGTIDGVGAVHAFETAVKDGQAVKRTGQVSGKTAEIVIEEGKAAKVNRFNLDTGGEKLIALTFDDGPWPESTAQILDILKANGAKATFFTLGNRIDGLQDVVKRAYDEGNQICTHSWDHAAGSGQGVNLGYMTDQEQLDEFTKGYEAITAVTGAEASKVIRVPGGNLNENTARLLSTLATFEIGWNIDTRDWEKPGVQAIVSNIMQVQPGYIVLMHDGGGDRSQTVEALRQALPLLKEQGYQFVTMDELLSRCGVVEPLS